MNEKNILKTLWSVIILLLLMNIGMMAWFWLSGNKGVLNASLQPHARLYLEKEVGFNEQQIATYRELRDEHLHELRDLRDSVKALKQQFFNKIPDTKIAPEEITKLTKELGDKMAKVDKITFEHFQEVRKICTPEQLKKFDEIIGNFAEKANRPDPPPPPREGNNEQPPENEPPQGERPPQ